MEPHKKGDSITQINSCDYWNKRF